MSSYDELSAQIAELQKRANAALEREKADAIGTMKETIAKYKITAKDLGLTAILASGKTKPPTILKGAPKYKNPETGETWTGRGPAPSWIKDKERDAFLIDR